VKRLTVRVPRDVQEQILELVLYFARDSVSNALAWEARLRATLDALSDFYGLAVDEDASERTGQTLHKTVFEGTYLIHYRVDEKEADVVIANICHGARLPRLGEPRALPFRRRIKAPS